MTDKAAIVDFPSRIDVWWNSEAWHIREAQSIVREIEELGFGSMFMPEGANKDALVESAAFLSATERIVVGTGIANIHFRIPTPAEGGARTLAALHPRRFVLGLGVSHAPFVEENMKGTYAKPLATMRTYLERMNTMPAEVEAGARPVRLLAALGPKMIELSGELADGAHVRRHPGTHRDGQSHSRPRQMAHPRTSRRHWRGRRGPAPASALPHRVLPGARELPELVPKTGLR